VDGVHYQTASTPGPFPSFKYTLRADYFANGCDKTLFSSFIGSGQKKSKQVQGRQIIPKSLAKVKVTGVFQRTLPVPFKSKLIHGQLRSYESRQPALRPSEGQLIPQEYYRVDSQVRLRQMQSDQLVIP
jgi:hypothetical protein